MLQYLVTSYFMNKSLAPSPKKFNFEFTKSLLKCQLRVAFYPSRYILVDQLIHSFLLTLSLCLSLSLSVSLCLSLSLSLCLCLCLCLSQSLTHSLSHSLSLSLSVSLCLSVSLSLCLSVSLCLSLCLSVSLSSPMKELSMVLISATIQSGFVIVQPFEIHNTYHKLIKNQVISTSRIIC